MNETLRALPGLVFGGIFGQVFWALVVDPTWSLTDAAICLAVGTAAGLIIVRIWK